MIVEFYNTLKEKKAISIHNIRNIKELGLYNFFNKNIFYKENNDGSFYQKALSGQSEKSIASSKMLEILGLYKKDYSSIGNLRKECITFEELNSNLRQNCFKVKRTHT